MSSWKDNLWGQDGVPNCPRCGKKMRSRKSERGPFWGCSDFPNCRGTIHIGVEHEAKVVPMVKMPGSVEQESIWEAGCKDKFQSHMVVEAVAGSGKSFSMEQLCLRIKPTYNVAYCAFNKHIAKASGDRLRASKCNHVTCRTYHSFGLMVLSAVFPGLELVKRNRTVDLLNDNKEEVLSMGLTLNQEDPNGHWNGVVSTAVKLVSQAKNYNLDFGKADFEEQLEAVAKNHELLFTPFSPDQEKGLYLGARVVSYLLHLSLPPKDAMKSGSFGVNFDDLIWLPVALKLDPPKTFDYLIVDEFQDSNRCQQEFVFRLCPKGRILVVGDRNQAIYAWRGADSAAIPRAIERFGATKRGVECFPLTVTRRCPKSHVRLAQEIVPQIRAMEDAPEGEVFAMGHNTAVSLMKPGDMGICRVNRHLIPTAYALIKRGVKVTIRGQEFGDGLISLIEKMEKQGARTLPELAEALQEWYEDEMEMLRAAKRPTETTTDKYDCLREMLTGSGSVSIGQLKHKLQLLFSEFDEDGKPVDSVVLGTVHRTKGLESTRVFILAPELIPHPLAASETDIQGERNIAYIAVTRAKYDATNPGTLVFCGSVPSIYGEAGKTVRWYSENATEEPVSEPEPEVETDEETVVYTNPYWEVTQ